MSLAAIIALVLALACTLLICRQQSRDNLALRRQVALLTLAWRSPESVAGRDILPGASVPVRYGLLRELMVDGLVQEHEWSHRLVRGKQYRQFRYHLLPAGFKELRRDWK